jgi:signal transduction histidine kinase
MTTRHSRNPSLSWWQRAGSAWHVASARLNNLYLRIWLTVVAVLALFALVAGWLFQSNVEHERDRVRSMWSERATATGALIENSLPDRDAPVSEQRAALLDWSARLRLPLALDDPRGQRIATSDSFARREHETAYARSDAKPSVAPAAGDGAQVPGRTVRVLLSDGRALWIMRPWPGAHRGAGPGREGGIAGDGPRAGSPPLPPFGRALLAGGGLGLVAALVLLFVAIALGTYPVVRRLTRRLEALQRGVESFGSGQLSQRVDARGHDEVAALARSFNAAAQHIEALVTAHRSLLANASHELRSPLTRMKMALAMLEQAPPQARAGLRQEVEANIRELDTLVEEVLLASRLDAPDAASRAVPHAPVALLAIAAEEGARVNAVVGGDDVTLQGDERLLRRALRNLLENAQRYGGETPPEADIRRTAGGVQVRICDRGPGVAPEHRERIFEPFYRLPGHAEQAGGVGLGLSLVRQIARAHHGSVHCEGRDGGGSCFVLSLPA